MPAAFPHRRCVRPLIGVLALTALLAGCGERAAHRPWTATGATAAQTVIDARLASDAAVDSLVWQYGRFGKTRKSAFVSPSLPESIRVPAPLRTGCLQHGWA